MSVLSSEDEEGEVTISRRRYNELLTIEFCSLIENGPYLHKRSDEESIAAKSHFAEYLSSQCLYYGDTLDEAKRKAKRTKRDISETMIHQVPKAVRLSRATFPEEDN